MNKKVELLKTCNLELFKDVAIEARVVREGKYIAFHFTKFTGKKSFSIPNFSYPEKKILSNYDSSVIKDFAYHQGITNREKAYQYVGAYSKRVISEYEKTGIVDIRGDLAIGGKNIIFYPDKEHFIAYVPDVTKITNKHWKSKLIEDNKVEEQWYAGAR